MANLLEPSTGGGLPPRRVGPGTPARRRRTWLVVMGRAAWCGRGVGRGVGLGLVAALFASRPAIAQMTIPPRWFSSAVDMRLSVRPGDATGTRTAQGGLQALDSLTSVYVPAQCVGTRRCPLVVLAALPEDNRTLASFLELQRPFADEYGMIVLVPAALHEAYFPQAVDTVLRAALRTYAIEPNKIALVGYRVHEDFHMFQLGCENLAVFSRLALLSPIRTRWRHVCEKRVARDMKTRVYLAGGLGELSFIGTAVRFAQAMRRAGYSAEAELALRGYRARPEDFERLWRWLHDSWATPGAAGTPTLGGAPAAAAAVGPLLTTKMIDQLTAFWSRFMQEPASIRDTARRAHQQSITVPIRTERFTLSMMDTPAMAAAYPSVAAALKAAGLTAEQADAYRAALIIAAANLATWKTGGEIAPVDPASRLGQNMTFIRAHKAALLALGDTGMWVTP